MAERTAALGTASVLAPEGEGLRPRLKIDGECVTETLKHLERGYQHEKPMERKVLKAVHAQATEVLEDICQTYIDRVASGEVGAEGTAIAIDMPPIADECPTGLLYGRVQSGKTLAMTITTAMAIDNGFRTIVVLTSNNLELVDQTAFRFGVLDGPLIFSSLEGSGDNHSWDREEDNIRQWLGARGVVFVCAKEDGHLKQLVKFLDKIGAADYPALIMDDEADHATPDTRAAARSRGRPVASASTTFRRVVYNDLPKEAGESLREVLRHNVFLQVTATPYCLLLQNLESPLRPSFTRLLKPGQGYTGGDYFFSGVNQQDEKAPAPYPLIYVSEDEGQALQLGGDPPAGFRRSIAFFLLAAAARKHLTEAHPRNGYKYLCHTSLNKAEHQRMAENIKRYVNELAIEIVGSPDVASRRDEVRWAYTELGRDVKDPPKLEVLLRDIGRLLPNRKILVVNSEGDHLKFGPHFNFVIGGNILGRGLTIDDLLVTYYLRQARMTQMDTMHQHARMYGYRKPLVPYTRVFLPHSLAVRFTKIHESETALRKLFFEGAKERAVPIATSVNLRATRPGVLDVGNIAAYRPKQQVYPVNPVHEPAELGNSTALMDTIITSHLAKVGGAPKKFVSLPFDLMEKLIRSVVVQPGDGEWDTEAILQVIAKIASRYPDGGRLYIREMKRTETYLPSGAISGGEQSRARKEGVPVLFLFKDGNRPNDLTNPWSAPFWYPTLSFPPDMPIMVFNRS